MNISFTNTTFKDLTTFELYQILHLRAAVFVVEQNCVYQDIDHYDQQATHILGTQDNKLCAYARIFPQNSYHQQASIGRVLVAKEFRKQGLGHQLLQYCIHSIETDFKTSTIHISAQTYLIDFYQQHGFKVASDEYLEDGIPHVGMRRG